MDFSAYVKSVGLAADEESMSRAITFANDILHGMNAPESVVRDIAFIAYQQCFLPRKNNEDRIHDWATDRKKVIDKLVLLAQEATSNKADVDASKLNVAETRKLLATAQAKQKIAENTASARSPGQAASATFVDEQVNRAKVAWGIGDKSKAEKKPAITETEPEVAPGSRARMRGDKFVLMPNEMDTPDSAKPSKGRLLPSKEWDKETGRVVEYPRSLMWPILVSDEHSALRAMLMVRGSEKNAKRHEATLAWKGWFMFDDAGGSMYIHGGYPTLSTALIPAQHQYRNDRAGIMANSGLTSEEKMEQFKLRSDAYYKDICDFGSRAFIKALCEGNGVDGIRLSPEDESTGDAWIVAGMPYVSLKAMLKMGDTGNITGRDTLEKGVSWLLRKGGDLFKEGGIRYLSRNAMAANEIATESWKQWFLKAVDERKDDLDYLETALSGLEKIARHHKSEKTITLKSKIYEMNWETGKREAKTVEREYQVDPMTKAIRELGKDVEGRIDKLKEELKQPKVAQAH